MTDFSKIKNLFHITQPCGFTKQDLAPWVETFGSIPMVLMDYYAELGAYKDLNHTQDFLITPKDIPHFLDTDYLIFYSENQGVSVWGIHKSDILKDDPPVCESYDGNVWYQTCDTLTSFLTSMAFLQALFCKEYCSEDYWAVDLAGVNRIAEHFKTKEADSGLYTGIRFFGNYDDSIIAVMCEQDQFSILFSSDDLAHFEEMHATLTAIL